MSFQEKQPSVIGTILFKKPSCEGKRRDSHDAFVLCRSCQPCSCHAPVPPLVCASTRLCLEAFGELGKASGAHVFARCLATLPLSCRFCKDSHKRPTIRQRGWTHRWKRRSSPFEMHPRKA